MGGPDAPREGGDGGDRDGALPVLRLAGKVGRDDIAGLCDDLRRLLEAHDAPAVICDVRGLVEPCLAAVDALAALQLVAKEAGRAICVRSPSQDLLNLLDLAGLREIVGQPEWPVRRRRGV